jgi:hypothetical protein
VAIALCAAIPLRAQLIQRTEGFRFGLGLGVTLPMGDYGKADKMGINILGVFETPLANSPLYLTFNVGRLNAFAEARFTSSPPRGRYP